ILGVVGCSVEEDKKAISQPPPATTSVPQPDDKNQFLAYHRDLMAKVNEADAMYEPFRAALQKSDIVEATSIALRIKTPMLRLWGDIRGLETPDLQNKDAKKKLDQAKDAISGSYLYKAKSVEGWIKFTETQDMKRFAELKNKAEDMKTLLYGGIVYLTEAGNLVGVDLLKDKK
ncbi:hypothetical protein, partial [Acidaminobacter sp.]|uniref:hypothetical protein n=1 Tax=Acidaminobacter sp. TaxID=1872102 RepID=UPI00255EC691